jgi:hypothetical protein
MFLAMKVDEYVVKCFAKPDRVDGEIKVPTLALDLENAAADGFELWLVIETLEDADGNFNPTYTAMRADEFFATYTIDEIPENPRDWIDVSKR